MKAVALDPKRPETWPDFLTVEQFVRTRTVY